MRRLVAMVGLCLSGNLVSASGLQSQLLFESDGSMLDPPFVCEVGLAGGGGQVVADDGNPAPAFSFTNRRAARVAPFALPELLPGQTLRGSWDVKTELGTGDLCLGVFARPMDGCSALDPSQGYWPVPTFGLRVSDGRLDGWLATEDGGIENPVYGNYPFQVGRWYSVALNFTAAADGNFDWVLWIDDEVVTTGRSFQAIDPSLQLGVNIGSCGTHGETHVKFDNIRVEVLDVVGPCCTNGPGTETECVVQRQFDCEAERGLFVGHLGEDCNIIEDCFPLLVTFDSIAATATRQGVLLEWTTAHESDTVGFRVLRSTPEARQKSEQVLGFVPSTGQGLGGASYFFLDNERRSLPGTQYFLEDIDTVGRVTRHGPIEVLHPVRGRPRTRVSAD